jgi:hypothetical protein
MPSWKYTALHPLRCSCDLAIETQLNVGQLVKWIIVTRVTLAQTIRRCQVRVAPPAQARGEFLVFDWKHGYHPCNLNVKFSLFDRSNIDSGNTVWVRPTSKALGPGNDWIAQRLERPTCLIGELFLNAGSGSVRDTIVCFSIVGVFKSKCATWRLYSGCWAFARLMSPTMGRVTGQLQLVTATVI